jgi:hypothetical protein
MLILNQNVDFEWKWQLRPGQGTENRCTGVLIVYKKNISSGLIRFGFHCDNEG